MFIVSIHVRLTQGKFLSSSHLRKFIENIFKKRNPRTQQHRGRGVFWHDAAVRSGFVFVPCTATLAALVWMNEREFEVVVATSFGADLFRSTESVFVALSQKFKENDIRAQMEIEAKSLKDGHTYVFGQPNTLWTRLKSEMKDNFVSICIAGIMTIVSSVTLRQFHEEAWAALITIALFSAWEVYDKVLRANHRQPILWRVRDVSNSR